MVSARKVNCWSSHANAFPASYAPPVLGNQTHMLHEVWNATKGHWTLMDGAKVLCDCGKRDDTCRRCKRGTP